MRASEVSMRRNSCSFDISGLQTGGHLVEVGKAGRNTGHLLALRLQLLDGVEARLRQLLERDEPIAYLVVGNRKDRVLGLIEDDVSILLGVVGQRHDLVGRE